jgi:hypothetical protein
MSEEEKENNKEEAVERQNRHTKASDISRLARQEENWRLMTILQVPWHHANKIDDPNDRTFLMEKVDEVEVYLKEQMQQAQQQQMQQPPNPMGAAGMPMGVDAPTQSSIITPENFVSK